VTVRLGERFGVRAAGSVDRMEGGIGIFLLLVVAVVVVVLGIALYVTGGTLWGIGGSRDDEPGDKPRPRHKAPRDPAQEHVHFVGTPEGDEAARRERAAQQRR
jgi:hypothetical protein